MDDDELYEIASGRAERDAGLLYADGTLTRWDQISRAAAVKEEEELWHPRTGLEVRQEAERRRRHRFLAEADMPDYCIHCGVNKASHGWSDGWAE